MPLPFRMNDVALRVAALAVHPVKSCGSVAVDEALVIETGLEFDRTWMVVDEAGRFLTQREQPRMVLVRITLRSEDMVLRAPGMLALHVRFDAVEGPATVTVWNDTLPAYDMGDLCAQWFSDFLGRRVRLARFDPEQRRLSSRQWTGDIEAENAFSDGYPILVASTASLDELNRRLVAAGEQAVTMERFRPNLVISGVEAHDEDHLDELRFETDEGPVVLRLVKPCPRCPMPDVDPATAQTGHAVTDTLMTYRADPRVDGALTFGMNAVIVEGIDRALRVGMAGSASYRFD
jgi:uncharacterized protein